MRKLADLLPTRLWPLLCVIALGCSKTTGGQTGDEDALPPPEDFFSDLAGRQGGTDYQPARDVAELASWSERIVVGHPVALRRGRTIATSESTRPSEIVFRTVVLEIAVERTLRGEDRDALYLEFLAGPGEPSLSVPTPQSTVIAFATPVTHDWFTDAVVMGRGDGLPEGETLYELRTPQGFAFETEDGGFVQPFESGDRALGAGSFEDLVQRTIDAITAAPDAGAQGTDGGSSTTLTLCDGSDAIRFAYDVSGGFLSPDDQFLAPNGFAFLYVRGDCHFVVSHGPYGEIREGDLGTDQAAALATAVHLDEIASLGQTPDNESCPDAGSVTVRSPDGALSCTCGCPDPRGDEIFTAAGTQLESAWQAGTPVTGPLRAVAYVPPDGIAWWQGSDVPQTWPLTTSLAELAVADAGAVTATSGLPFEGDDAAMLRELRDKAQSEGTTVGQVQRFPVREREAGEVHALLVRDELPADIVQAIAQLPAGR